MSPVTRSWHCERGTCPAPSLSLSPSVFFLSLPLCSSSPSLALLWAGPTSPSLTLSLACIRRPGNKDTNGRSSWHGRDGCYFRFMSAIRLLSCSRMLFQIHVSYTVDGSYFRFMSAIPVDELLPGYDLSLVQRSELVPRHAPWSLFSYSIDTPGLVYLSGIRYQNTFPRKHTVSHDLTRGS